MNFEFPTDPRKALEASLTALLLGELPDEQARFLRQAIATDPELAKTFEALKRTIELVRETEAEPKAEPMAAVDAPKLSDQRRQELLQRFKTVQPAQFKGPMRRRFSWLMPVAAAVAFMMIVSALLLPVFSKKANYTAQLSLSEPASREQLNGTDVMVLSALRREKATGKLAEDRIVRSTGSTLQHSAGARPISSVIAPESLTPALQSKIILPAEGKPESETLGVASEREEKRDWGYQSQTVVVGGEASLANQAVHFQTFSAGQGGGGLGGGAPGNIQKQVPILSYEPRIGRLSRSASAPSNAPDLAGANERIPILGDVPAADKIAGPESPPGNVPELAANNKGWSLDSDLRGFYDDTSAPFIGGLEPQYKAAPAPFQKDGKPLISSQPQAVNFGEPQQAAGPVNGSYGTYYGGGAFGGYSTIQPITPKPGQQLQTITIQGVGEVDVLSGDRADDSMKSALEKAPVALPEITAKAGDLADAEAGRKATLAGLDAKKTELAQVRKAEEAQTVFQRSKKEVSEQSKNLALALRNGGREEQEDLGAARQAPSAPELQPELKASENSFSTFSLNVSDVSFKLGAASLEKGVLPDPAGIRCEEFINAFDYRDPEPADGVPVSFAWERAAWPFAQNRDLLRFSIKTAAAGRQPGRPLNIVLLLDNSGSMERADRVNIIREALRVLASQLGKQDTLSVVTFARTARLWVDGIPGDQAGVVADELSNLTPQGGTNLEEAMNLAYQTAIRHYSTNGMNRVVLLTDGAANLGDTDPEALKKKVETNRKQGIALDCFGIGWEGYNDDLLEVLTRNGDGRYGFLNTPEEAASGFAGQLAGALHVAANDVKVQVEFNTNRVSAYRQIGYARHQLTKEQFRDNTVNAAAIGAAESGNALYVIESNPQGEGPLAVVRVRYRIPSTGDYREQEWTVPFTGVAAPLEQASPAMRLSATAGAFSEWLATSPYAAEVTTDRLLGFLNGLPSVYGADPRPQKLEWMIRQAKAISGK